MSRPWSSVPSKNLLVPPSIQAGGKRASLNSSVARSNGLVGETQPAKTEQKRQMKAMAAATIAMGDWRKL